MYCNLEINFLEFLKCVVFVYVCELFFMRWSMCFQALHDIAVPQIDCALRCAPSADSFSGYGQFAISQSGLGHIMYSAATAQSTMDFSILPVDDGVVDNPSNGGKCPLPKSSPSPVKICARSTSPGLPSQMNIVTQKKLYEDDVDVLRSPKVWALYNILLF